MRNGAPEEPDQITSTDLGLTNVMVMMKMKMMMKIMMKVVVVVLQ